MTKGRGKRGVASCSKKYEEDDYNIEFDEDMQPAGVNADKFSSWLGVKCKVDFPYHIPTNEFSKKKWDDFWEETKKQWNIPNDLPKSVVIKKAKKQCTNWRSFLVRHFVRFDKTPFDKYTYLDDENWEEFVAAKTSHDFLEKSEKAKASAHLNKHPSCSGRGGNAGLKPKVKTRWDQLLASHPHLKSIKDPRSIKWVVARAKKNRQSKLYEVDQNLHETVKELALQEQSMIKDGSYFKGKGDPLTRVLGPEHGGRSRTVSVVLGSTQVHGGLFKCARKQNHDNTHTTQARTHVGDDASPDIRGSSYASGGSCLENHIIEHISRCHLLFPQDPSCKLKVASGLVYPTSVRTLHGCQIDKACVKVQVDTIEVSYEKLPVHPLTYTDEVKRIGDTRNQYIQWPSNAIELVGTETPCKSRSISSKAPSNNSLRKFQPSPQIDTQSCYRPRLDDLDQHENQQSQYERQMGGHFQMDADLIENFTDLIDSPQVAFSQVDFPKDPDEEVIMALKKIDSSRPQPIQTMAAQLESYYGDMVSIEIDSPVGMYPEICNEYLEYKGVLQLLANDKVDISIVHWCEMYLYELSESRSKTYKSRCAFFNTVLITGEECNSSFANVQEHILSVYAKHLDKSYFLAPFLNGEHWSLFIVSPTQQEGYILDSMMGMKNKYDYPITKVIEETFGDNFNWQMVKCRQHRDDWECGYMMMQNMIDFVMEYQYTFPKRIWNNTSYIKQEDVDNLLSILMPQFFRKVFDEV
ncbi:hypothetical protein SSX86_031929 [Deinandra increscens subsp. villosa]|uniref:Ubiquitin-like protease family profile domain-containing protein n=1 Tax=Deinandra increscens subsp. villosa TaxID=3103831 RepID=A0AAP0C917_9ASTR